jgi:hypothetical protein
MIRFDENVSYSAIILKTSMIFDEKELTQDFENLKSMQVILHLNRKLVHGQDFSLCNS